MADFFSKKMLIVFFLGFSNGIPFLLTSGTLKLWLARENIEISTIGYFSWVGLSYSLKFIWAPFLDRFTLFPVGRRRSWMLMSQVMLIFGISLLGAMDPKVSLQSMAIVSVCIAFFSATQDIATDAFRREFLTDEEISIGSTAHQYGYKLAMLIAGGLGVGLVGSEVLNLSWNQLYYALAAMMLIGVGFTLWATEPVVATNNNYTLRAAVIDPFKELFKRDNAIVMILFVMLYKFGDAMSGAMLTPYYVHIGFTNADIGLIAKIYGLIAALVGLFIGSMIVYWMGVFRSLVIFGVLQSLSTGLFALLLWTGPARWALGVTVCFEDIASGMGTAAFITFLATMTNKKYTATQYAILSSVATLGRNFLSGFSGHLVNYMGWEYFYYFCALLAIPGMGMLFVIQKRQALDQH